MDCVQLAGGEEVLIRPLRADDGDRLRSAHARLSAQTQYRRFLAPKPHLSSSDVRYLVEVDGSNHFALVAIAANDPDRIVAVGRFIRLAEDPEVAELAVVVGDRFQDQGLGGELLERLAEAAKERGISRLQATVLADNVPVHRLVAHLPVSRIRERHLSEIDEIEVELAA